MLTAELSVQDDKWFPVLQVHLLSFCMQRQLQQALGCRVQAKQSLLCHSAMWRPLCWLQCLPSPLFLSEGKAVGAGALQRGHVWVVSVGRKALKSHLQSGPVKLGELLLSFWRSSSGLALCSHYLQGCFSSPSSSF